MGKAPLWIQSCHLWRNFMTWCPFIFIGGRNDYTKTNRELTNYEDSIGYKFVGLLKISDIVIFRVNPQACPSILPKKSPGWPSPREGFDKRLRFFLENRILDFGIFFLFYFDLQQCDKSEVLGEGYVSLFRPPHKLLNFFSNTKLHFVNWNLLGI